MTDFLFAKPDFLSGAMTVLDLFAVSQNYNESESPEDADRRAFTADLMALAGDMQIKMPLTKSQSMKYI